MQRTVVESSCLEAVGYDHANLVLEVQFKNGHVYRYFNVPYVAVEQLMTARSLGRHFNSNIRDRFRYRRMK